MIEPWSRTIGLADMYGTVAHVSFDPADGDGDAMATIHFSAGAARLIASPTPEALRQLAAAYLDAADAVEGK